MKKKNVIVVGMLLAFFISIVLIVCFVSNNNSNSDTYNENYTENYTEEYNKDNDIYEEVLHKTEIPDGYIGIYSVDDFEYIKTSPQYNYILMNDIDFKSVLHDEDPYKLDGIFDGNNYTISNYNSTHPLFDHAKKICDVTFNNANIETPSKYTYIAVICKYTKASNSTSEDEFSLYNCHVKGNINVQLDGSESSSDDRLIKIGGIVSDLKNNSSIFNCSFNGKIRIVDTSDREHSYKIFVGGITGMMQSASKLNQCLTNGNIELSSKNDYSQFTVGGLAGFVTGKDNNQLVNSGNKMNINGDTRASHYGGIAGKIESGSAYLSQLYNKGNITSTSNWNGSEAYTITELGGIVGNACCVIYDCYNAGNINGGEYAGGIVGMINSVIINNVYNVGNVSSHKMHEKYYKGAIEGGSYFIGEYGELEYCYYKNENLSATYDSAKFPFVSKLDDQEFRTQEKFEGFDFDNIWEMGTGDYPYPILCGIEGQ